MKQWERFVSRSCVFLLCYLVIVVEGWNCHDGGRIEDDWLCDGQNDCNDGSDEMAETCPDRACEKDQFRCNNTRCIHVSFRCDGEADCSDEDDSDEYGCPEADVDESCRNKFRCRSGEGCLPLLWKCDGERDCEDSSDEFDCLCKHNTYGCYVRGASLCLDNATKCDGIKHCDNGEDEKCEYISRPFENVSCPHSGMFKCRSREQCIPWKLVCDGIDDCRDRSDEDGLCHVNDCWHKKDTGKTKGIKKACEQYCHESPNGGVCTCGDGFELAKDGVHCLDIDECNDMLHAELPHRDNSDAVHMKYDYGMKKLCSQKCVNLPGSFRCTCAEGYLIDADEFTCKALGDYMPDLFAGVANEIRVFSLRDPGDKTLYYDEVYKSDRPDESFIDMDAHIAESALFWIEDKSGQLKMKRGRDVSAFSLDFKPTAVCVDWVTGNLLVSTRRKEPNHVANLPAIFLLASSVASPKLRLQKVAVEILSLELQSPVDLAIYPQKGILLVADAGLTSVGSPGILIANVDGTNVRNLVSKNILTPTSLVVDSANDVVFWSSVGDGGAKAKVESIRLDGARREVLLSLNRNQFPIDPVSLATFENHLYISDKKASEVRSWKIKEITLNGNENTMYASESIIKLRRSGMGSILVSHPVLQRPLRGSNPCRSAGCSHICVIVPSVSLQVRELLRDVDLQARCLCPAKYRLDQNRKTCRVLTGENRRGSTLTVLTGGNRRGSIGTTFSASTTSSTTAASTTTSTSPVSPTIVETSALCRNPGSVENAISSPVRVSSRKSFAPGAIIRYTCFKGFVIKGGFTPVTEFDITCTQSGKWSASLLTCKRESFMTKLITSLQAPHLQGGKKQPPKDDFIQSIKKTPQTRAKKRQRVCTGLRCEPWGRCVRKGNGGYKCACFHGESTSASRRCLPPPSTVATGNFTDTTATSSASQTSRSRGLTPSMTALIVVAVLLFVLMLVLCYRCMRKKRYSVDLRYFSGRAAKQSFTKETGGETAVIECSVNGKPTSITNPNYTSPSQRKRLPKPTFADDLSDSGIQQSLGSGSLSSSTSDNSTGEGTSSSVTADASNEPRTDQPLLGDEMRREESLVLEISEDNPGELRKSTKPGPFHGRLGSLFKMRKTESRECMLPKKKAFRKSKPSRG